MRWHLIDPANEPEAAYKRHMIEKIDRFWASFEKAASQLEKDLEDGNLEPFVNWITQHLHDIHPELMWEAGGCKTENFDLVITPESSRELRPLVETLIGRAPEVSNWRFLQYREAQIRKVEDISDTRLGIDFTDARVSILPSSLNIIDLFFLSPKFDGDNDECDLGNCFALCELLLGEELLDKWVGNLETRSLKTSKKGKNIRKDIIDLQTRQAHCVTDGSICINNLYESFLAAQEQMIGQLPDNPHCCTEFDEYTSIFLKPRDESVDVPSRISFTTALPQIIEAVNNSYLFHSDRFSRVGEKFCYVKIAGAGELATNVQLRALLEDKIDSALRDAKAGCTYGGGTGPDYAFVDLALTEIPKAIEILRSIAAVEKLPKKSWLLFLDTDWLSEWSGLYHDSPVPDREGNAW